MGGNLESWKKEWNATARINLQKKQKLNKGHDERTIPWHEVSKT